MGPVVNQERLGKALGCQVPSCLDDRFKRDIPPSMVVVGKHVAFLLVVV